MKLLYFHYAIATFGGIERVIVDKMNSLANMGYEVFCITANQGKNPLTFKLNDNIHYEDLNVRTYVQYKYKGLHRYWERFKRNLLLNKRLYEKIKQIRPDIILTSTNGYITDLVRFKSNIPLIVEFHTGFDYIHDNTNTSWYNHYYLKRLLMTLKKANGIVVLTENDALKWRKRYSNVRVIPNVVHLNTSGIFSMCNNKRVIFVGRNCKHKAIPDLLKIWQMVYSKHSDWQLDMYVERDIKDLLEEANRLNSNIHIFPPDSNIMNHYIQSSILVLTSIYESFSLVIAEAMSCGIPVVSFESDGPCNIITNGKDGFIVKNRSKEEFANRVCQLIEDSNLRQQMGQNAIKSVQRFSAENVMPKWGELLDSLK
jgi:glycosyltransferase involved in cell wall biosynthesis